MNRENKNRFHSPASFNKTFHKTKSQAMTAAALAFDVWYTVGKNSNGFDVTHTDEVDTLKAGIALMKKYHKQGKHDLRMYVRDMGGDTSHNRVYFFRNGKLVFEKDNYNN